MDISYNIKPLIDGEQLQKDLVLTEATLDDAVMTHAAKYAYYAARKAEAHRQASRMKFKRDLVEAKLTSRYRQQLTDEGKKATDLAVTSAVKEDPRWIAAQSALIEAEYFAEVCDAAERAMGGRRDMVLSMAHDRRREREGEIRVREQNMTERWNAAKESQH